MKRVIFISDFLFHSPKSHLVYHNWIFNLLVPLLKEVGINECLEFKNIKNKQGESFSRDKFYKLSNIIDYTEVYYAYDSEKIKEDSWEYFYKFIDINDFYIGVELGIELRKKLDQFSIKFINLWIHSYKLFEDITLMVNTNDIKIYNVLVKHKIPLSKFYFSANYFKVYLNEKYLLADESIEENSCLFIGQMPYDKSVKCDGQFLNITNYYDKLLSLSREYSRIYYKEHPSFGAVSQTEIGKHIDTFIDQCDFIYRIASNVQTYSLLSSDKIKKVIGISSSVLYEAKFFGKDIEYLYKPLIDIDSKFGLNNFISVDDSFWSLNFWAELLDIDGDFDKSSYLAIHGNKLRKIRNIFFGYAYLDDETKILGDYANLKKELDNLKDDKTKILEDYDNLKKEIDNLKNVSPVIASDVYPHWMITCMKYFIFNKGKRSLFLSKHREQSLDEDISLPILTGGTYHLSEHIHDIFCKGFSVPETWGMWSLGHKACLTFKVVDNQKDVWIGLSGSAFINDANPEIFVEISCNNKLLYIWKFNKKHSQGTIDFVIKHNLISRTGQIDLSFYIDNPSSPLECGISSDKRNIGLGLSTLYVHRIIKNKIYHSKFFRNLRLLLILNKRRRLKFRDKYKLTNIIRNFEEIKTDNTSLEPMANVFVKSTSNKMGINSIGFFFENIGLSHHVRYFTRCIKSQGIPFGAKHFNMNRGNKVSSEFDIYMDDNLVYNTNVFNFNANYIIEYHKRYQSDFNNKYNIGYEYWEFDKFPDEFLCQNNILNEIWAPSDFILETLSHYHTIPIVKMPLAIDFNKQYLENYDRNYFNLPEKAFLFLFSFDIGSELSGRKNPKAAIDAFICAFPHRKKNVHLIIKATCRTEMLHNKAHIKILDDLKELCKKYNITLLYNDLSDLQMKALIKCCDVYISLHRCEGLGLGMMEAMKLGKPVIATNYSGNKEFSKFDNSCLVNFTLTKAPVFLNLMQGHVWADPDIEHAAWYMNKLYDDKSYYRKISINAKKYIDINHSPKYVGNLIKDRLTFLGLI